jgi:hypothetical protein
MGRETMTTWIQVMTQVRRIDEQRRRQGRIDEGDADRLVTMLLEFHGQAVATSPPGDAAPVRAPEGKSSRP